MALADAPSSLPENLSLPQISNRSRISHTSFFTSPSNHVSPRYPDPELELTPIRKNDEEIFFADSDDPFHSQILGYSSSRE